MSALTHEIFIQFRDADGDVTTRSWEVPNSVAITDVPILAAELMDLMVPLINGTIVKAGYTAEVTVPVLVAQALSDVQELLAVGARTTNGFLKRMHLPTIDEAKVFLPGSKEADLADADVLAYTTALISGIDLTGAGGSGTVQFSDGRGEDLTSIEYAVEAFNA
jgi:hypothetical protein